MADNKEIKILNLVGDLPESLKNYFDKASIIVMERGEVQEFSELSYILVSTVEESKAAVKEFLTDENEIKILCLGDVSNMRDYLLANGRLVLDPAFELTQLSEYALNKFFKENFNIHLYESFSSSFDNVKDFKITNHLASGFNIDLVSLDAFENGFNIVSLRSFIDHVIYYFTYLKQAGLAGIPFEFEYGFNDEYFVLNVHAPVRNFVAEYMIDSFGPVNSKDPLSYLLGVIARSCDFLDITYVEDPGKVSLTSFYSKAGNKSFKGLSFNNIKTTAQVLAQLEKKVREYTPEEEVIASTEKKQESLVGKKLPGGIMEMVTPPSVDSVLSEEPAKTKEMIDFAVGNFENSFPDMNIADFNIDSLDSSLAAFPDQGFVDQLSDDDKAHLVERVQKNQIAEAYDEEVQRVREELKDDDSLKNTLQDTLTEEVAEKVTGAIDANILNSILSPDLPEDDAFANITGFEEPEEGAINVSGGTEEDPFAQKVSGGHEKVDGATNVKGGKGPGKEPTVKIGGGPDDPEGSTVVKGGKDEADDFMQKISSLNDEDKNPFMTSFSNAFGEDAEKGKFNFKSTNAKEKKDSMKMFVKNTLDGADGLKDLDPKVKAFIHKEVPEKLAVGLDQYAEKLGQTADSLSDLQLNEFKTTELPKIMSDVMSHESSIMEFKAELEGATPEPEPFTLIQGGKAPGQKNEFEKKFKSKLEEKLENYDGVDKVDGQYQVSDNQVSETQMQTIVKETMKEAFAEEFKFESATKEEIDTKEKEIIKNLSDTLGMPEAEVTTIVKGAATEAKEKEREAVAEKLYSEQQDDTVVVKGESGNDEDDSAQGKSNTMAETALISKLKKAEEENQSLQKKVSAMELKLKSGSEADKKLEDIQEEAKSEADKASKDEENKIKAPEAIVSHAEAVVIKEKLASGEELSPEDAQKIAQTMEKEQQILQMAKEAEVQIKKMQIEGDKKDALFKAELERAQKLIKSKEFVLEKAKDSMKNVVKKKEKEITTLKGQVNTLNQKLESDQSTKLAAQLKTLEKEREGLIRSAEVYKGKLESMAKSMSSNKKVDNSAVVAEENRNLKKLKNQLENKMNSEIKAKRSLEDRYQKTKVQETKAKTELAGMKGELKSAQGQLRMLKDANEKLKTMAAKQSGAAVAKNGKEAELLKSQNTKLQEKINLLSKKLDEASKVKEPDKAKTEAVDLQNSKVELAKATKEIDLLKQQNAKLQESVEKAKSENNTMAVQDVDPAKVAEVDGQKDKSELVKTQKEVELAKKKNEELMAKMKEMKAKFKKKEEEAKAAANSADPSAKEKRLEQSVKKMNSELTKTKAEMAEKKKEHMKMKTEVTGLKNQLAKMKKDLERAEAAAKKGGKKKKAA